MVCQHRELHHRLGDAKKLRLYAQSVISKHQALDDALVKAKARFKHWEWEAKAGVGKTASLERKRDEAKEEVQLALLAAVTTGDVKALAEDKLARVQDALMAMEEASRKAEVEAARLEVELTSLLLEIRMTKDEVSSLHSQGQDKEAMEEDY